MSRRLALLAAVALAALAAAGPAAAAPAPPTAQGITLEHEGFETPTRTAVVVLIGANDYGLVAPSD